MLKITLLIPRESNSQRTSLSCIWEKERAIMLPSFIKFPVTSCMLSVMNCSKNPAACNVLVAPNRYMAIRGRRAAIAAMSKPLSSREAWRHLFRWWGLWTVWPHARSLEQWELALEGSYRFHSSRFWIQNGNDNFAGVGRLLAKTQRIALFVVLTGRWIELLRMLSGVNEWIRVKLVCRLIAT